MSDPVHDQITELVTQNKVVLFMKGNRHFPQCGFSAAVVRILDELLPSYKTVNVLTEPGGALAGALALAERITANGPLAVAVTKEIIVKSSGWTAEEMWKKQGELVMPVFSSKDAMEGATAFAEKRAPNWTGS